MPNRLTGDFEGVLQVSGATVNRLVASLHQNGFEKPELPTIPHSAVMRIGDTQTFDGLKGLVHAQIGAPQIELIDGVTDRFRLHVPVMARYQADAGSTPLPEFIQGTVSAEYRFQAIDPDCAGWRGIADQFLWVRVVRESVEFDGTAFDDTTRFTVSTNRATTIGRIAKQVALLLATRFEATPHRVGSRFRRGSMRSLAAAGQSCVAIPLALTGPPAGNIASVQHNLLDNADFAAALQSSYLLLMFEPALDTIRAYTATFHTVVAAWPFEKHFWHQARVNNVSAKWDGHGTHALITVTVDGHADNADLPFAFRIVITLMARFNATGSVIELTRATDPHVEIPSFGILELAGVGTKIRNEIQKAVRTKVDELLPNHKPSLAALPNELRDVLKSLDDQATAVLDSASFEAEGLILRGTIGLSARKPAEAKFELLEQEDCFSAFASWAPGGHVESFTWSWSWYGSTQPGTETFDDRFLLRRPKAARARWGGSRYGMETTRPLPGIDGNGRVCLKIAGRRVDPVTGLLVPFVTRKACMRYGYPIAVGYNDSIGSLYWRAWPDEPELSSDSPFPDTGLMSVSAGARGAGVNTLVVFTGSQWNVRVLETLHHALEASRRDDAGLVVQLLFADGFMRQVEPGLLAEIEAFGGYVGAPVLVSEDVNGAWSRALDLPERVDGAAWRLLGPGGGLVWQADAPVNPEMLARVLDECLYPTPPPRPVAMTTGVEIGMRVPSAALRAGDTVSGAEDRCPPFPLSRMGESGSRVVFVELSSPASVAQARELTAAIRESGGSRAFVAIVTSGRTPEGARDAADLFDESFAVLPDPDGAIARRLGIRVWPTTVTLDGRGTVTDLKVGRRERERA